MGVSAPGIIPADAGSTFCLLMTFPSHGDHPRGCGEHNCTFGWEKPELGSSPRMRGALSLTRHFQLSGRIIPADAGSTQWLQRPNGKF